MSRPAASAATPSTRAAARAATTRFARDVDAAQSASTRSGAGGARETVYAPIVVAALKMGAVDPQAPIEAAPGVAGKPARRPPSRPSDSNASPAARSGGRARPARVAAPGLAG